MPLPVSLPGTRVGQAMCTTPRASTASDGPSSGQPSIAQPSSLTLHRRRERASAVGRARDGHVAQVGRVDVAPGDIDSAVGRGRDARLAAETDVRGDAGLGALAVRPRDRLVEVLPHPLVTRMPGALSARGLRVASVQPRHVNRRLSGSTASDAQPRAPGQAGGVDRGGRLEAALARAGLRRANHGRPVLPRDPDDLGGAAEGDARGLLARDARVARGRRSRARARRTSTPPSRLQAA